MMRFWRAVGVLGALVAPVFLAACAETQLSAVAVKQATRTPAARHGTYKVGDPYQINGVWYYPAEDYSYSETGIASWYGPDFHGKYTADGEIFDQNAVTAAHRTLPMPSVVRVTDLDNGRSVVVRVNDRGPFAHGRIIDLSRRAAQLLGFERQGTARVRVQILAAESVALKNEILNGEAPAVAAAPRDAVVAETLPPPNSREKPHRLTVEPVPPPQTAPPTSVPVADARQLARQKVAHVAVHPTHMFIQAGAFARFDNAHRVSAALSPIGPTVVTQVRTAKGATLFRVRVGPIASVDTADAMLEQVIHSGYPDARLVVD